MILFSKFINKSFFFFNFSIISYKMKKSKWFNFLNITLIFNKNFNVPRAGIEPATRGSSGHCSTN